VNQGICRFPPRLLHDAREGRAGNLHLFCGRLLIETVKIGQPQGFKFIQGEYDDFEGVHRNARRFEEIDVR